VLRLDKFFFFQKLTLCRSLRIIRAQPWLASFVLDLGNKNSYFNTLYLKENIIREQLFLASFVTDFDFGVFFKLSRSVIA
jgi:hypothetical protein